jgi:hypothetical protein
VPTIRSVTRFGGRAASYSALVLTLAVLVGLPSPGEAKPVMSATCLRNDVACSNTCAKIKTPEFYDMCIKSCDQKLKDCEKAANGPGSKPNTSVGGNNKALPGNTRFPSGRPAPIATTNVGGNTQTLGGNSITNAGGSSAAGLKPVTNAGPDRNAVSIGGAISISGARRR